MRTIFLLLVSAALLATGGFTLRHGVRDGILRRRIENRFTQRLDLATGRTALILGVLTATVGLGLVATGTWQLVDLFFAR